MLQTEISKNYGKFFVKISHFLINVSKSVEILRKLQKFYEEFLRYFRQICHGEKVRHFLIKSGDIILTSSVSSIRSRKDVKKLWYNENRSDSNNRTEYKSTEIYLGWSVWRDSVALLASIQIYISKQKVHWKLVKDKILGMKFFFSVHMHAKSAFAHRLQTAKMAYFRTNGKNCGPRAQTNGPWVQSILLKSIPQIPWVSWGKCMQIDKLYLPKIQRNVQRNENIVECWIKFSFPHEL